MLQVVGSSCKPAQLCCRSVVADCAVDVVVVAVGFDGVDVANDTDDVGSDVELAVDVDSVVSAFVFVFMCRARVTSCLFCRNRQCRHMT